MIYPFDCFKEQVPEKQFDNVFDMAFYWFTRSEKLQIYKAESSESYVKDTLMAIGIKKNEDEIKKMIQQETEIEEINDSETYILYKICKEFVQGRKAIDWEIIQRNNSIEKEYSVNEWVAGDKEHLFWITLKIMNGFDNFNPYRLSLWSFWRNICFMAQNERALKVLTLT